MCIRDSIRTAAGGSILGARGSRSHVLARWVVLKMCIRDRVGVHLFDILMDALDAVAGVHKVQGGACLLYTSRCV